MRWFALGLVLCFGSAATARAADAMPDPGGDIYRLLGKHLKAATTRGGLKAHPYYWAPFVLWSLPN